MSNFNVFIEKNILLPWLNDWGNLSDQFIPRLLLARFFTSLILV